MLGTEPIPDIDTNVDLSTTLDSFSDDHQEADDTRILSARTAALKRHRARSKRPIAVAGGLLIAALCLGGWAFLAGGKSVPVVQLKPDAPVERQEDKPLEPAVEKPPAFDYSTVSYVQALVDDGEATLWESPTTGLAIDFSWLPAGTEILFHLRGKELLNAPAIFSDRLIGDNQRTTRGGLGTTRRTPAAGRSQVVRAARQCVVFYR